MRRSGSALAQDKAAAPTPAPAVGAKYGLAGCGLGSVFFGAKLPVLAATTNGTSGNQTFGITSGTSNCTDTDSGKASAKAFIETNREELAKETARGKGESRASLAAIAGCSDTKAVSGRLQRNFKTIFPSQTATNDQVSDAILTTLQSEDLACGKIRS